MRFLIVSICLAFVTLVPFVVGAEGPMRLTNPASVDTIPALFEKAFDALLKIVLPFLVLLFVYSGWLFIKAQGNSKEIETAWNYFKYLMIGTAVFLGATALSRIVADTLSTITR